MAKKVTGEVLNQNYELQVKFNELYRQINQNNGYPFVFENLLSHLQCAVEGKFQNTEGVPKSEKVKSFIEIKTLTSDGRTGEQFLFDLEKAGLSVDDFAKVIMKSKEFNATVTTGTKYRVAVIKGSEFTDADRNTANIRKEIAKLGGIMPPAELAPLLRLNFSNEEIKDLRLMWLIPMHQPINDYNSTPEMLGLHATDFNDQLNSNLGEPMKKWRVIYGFVFLLPLSTEVLES